MGGLLLVCACERSSERPTDVVLIVIDTQRAQNLSVYGYERENSPNLERLARDGVVYAQATSPGTWTVPSHASLFTGLWPSHHGAERVGGDRILARPINPEVPTLAEILAQHGFATAAFVANNTYVSPSFGFSRGFGLFVDSLNYPPAEKLATAAVEWLDEQSGRVFLFMNFLDPHEPLSPPAPYDARFPGKNAAFGDMLTKRASESGGLTPEMQAHFISQYDGEMLYADGWIGKLLDALREQGRYRSSLIIVTSDHGELIGDHGLAGHGLEPFEPEVHVPLIVKYPGDRDAGSVVRERVSTLAVFATILDTLGIRAPEDIQSVPLGRPQPVFIEDIDPLGRRVRVVYDGGRKLVSIQSTDGKEHVSLYDLETDPGEERPVREGEELARMRAMLERFAAEPRRVNTAALPVIDPEKEAQLRALGYVR